MSRRRFTLVLLVLTSLTLLTLDFRGFGPIDSARSAMLSALAPIGHGAQAVVRPIGNLWDGAFKYDDLKRHDRALQAQVDTMKSQIAAGILAEQSNQQLLEQADLPFVGNLHTVRAAVVSGAVANFNDTIQISKGTKAGIRKDMPVVVGTGLVGIVVEVAPDRADGLLVLAKSPPVAKLRKEALRVKAAVNVDETYARIRQERSARMYTDAEGAWHLHAHGTVDDGADFQRVLARSRASGPCPSSAPASCSATRS